MSKSLYTLVPSVMLALVFSSCGSKYNKIKFKDPHAGSKEIYGVIGGEPLQLSGTFTPDPKVKELSSEVTPKFREQVEASFQK
jgi:hypothetical protein